jgi:non-ribosomal peptide synthetase component F
MEAPAVPARTLLEMIDVWTARQPDAVGVEGGRQVLRYRDLDRRSRALAGQLVRRGAATDVPVGVFLDRSVDLVVGLLAVLRAGAAYLPLDPDHPVARTKAVLADAGARFVLTRTDLLSRLPTGVASAVLVDAECPDASRTPACATPQGLAYVIYTSGSTGRPKGVEVTHASLGTFLHIMAELIAVSSSDTLLAVTTVTFDIAALELFLPLTRGGRVVLAPAGAAGDGNRLRDLIAAHGVTILQATPVTWRVLVPALRDEPVGTAGRAPRGTVRW